MSRCKSNSWSNLDEFEPVSRQTEDASLGDIQHGLLTFAGVTSAERSMLDCLDKLPANAVSEYLQPPSLTRTSNLPALKARQTRPSSPPEICSDEATCARELGTQTCSR